MKLNLIYATSAYNCIGDTNGLIWDIKDELRYFHSLTSKENSVLIMGRKTFELIKDKLKPNNREYIIFTNNLNYNVNMNIPYKLYNNIYKCINDIYNLKEYENKTFWVIGGKQIYELFEPYVERIYKSFIHYYHTLNLYEGDYIYYTHNETNTNCISTDFKNSYDNITKKEYMIEYKIYEPNPDNKLLNKCNENIYLHILLKTLNSNKRMTRNGYVYSYFSDMIKYNITNTIPILTTKKMFIRGIIEELLFFIKGQTNSKILEAKNINIWKGNTNKQFLLENNLNYEEGDMGPMYGFQWRHFNTEYTNCNDNYDNKGFDQFEFVINEILTNPYSRRIIMTTFHPTDALKSVLYPCHSLITQFYIENINDTYFVSIQMYQRSADVFLGLPFNITSISILLYIVCYECNRRINKNLYKPNNVIITLGDIHIYEEHLDCAKIQLNRTPLIEPTIQINSNKKFDELEYNDFIIHNYYSYDNLKAPMK